MSPFYFISPCHFHFKFLHTVSFRFRQWYLHINIYSYNSFLSKTICSSITQNTYMSQSLHYYNIFTFSHNLWWAKGSSYRICLYFLFQCIIMPTMIHYILLLLIFDCLPPILMPAMWHILHTADAAPFLLCFDGGRQQTTHFQVHYCQPLDWSMEQNLQHHQHHLLFFLIKR